MADCGEKGVCYGCSISCHSGSFPFVKDFVKLMRVDHRLIELWTKRSFRCDCPTTLMPPTSNGKRRRCALNPPGTQPGPSNEENHYNQNFAGRFCRCGKVYDPETEDEAMLNCMACEVGLLQPVLVKGGA
jgi:E3 ubiquitin-protein ligase UBR7